MDYNKTWYTATNLGGTASQWVSVGKSGSKFLRKTGIFIKSYNVTFNSIQIKLKLLNKNYSAMFFFSKLSVSRGRTWYICWNSVEKILKLMFQSIINSHPYHVDALLQLSELCRLSEDLPMAAELIERALYCLECAFHPSFNFAQGNCRLDYRKQENR